MLIEKICYVFFTTIKQQQKPHFRDFPGGPAVKTLSSLCRGPGFDSWSGIPHAATKSPHAATKDPAHCNEDTAHCNKDPRAAK